MNTSTPKGFRDFLPEQSNARQYTISKFIQTFRLFGFEPLETPAVEFAQTLTGKYGEDEKLIYKFRTHGEDEVALRFDQTVPLARVIAQYPNLPKPFKRYQIQPVWRGENPQQGRYREFLQCDIDTIGSTSALADVEIIACILETAKNLGFSDSFLEINDRSVFSNLEPKHITAIDKLKKIGDEGVIEELVKKGLSQEIAQKTLSDIKNAPITDSLQTIFSDLEKAGYKNGQDFKFTPTLARGLDYYTGSIFELVSPQYGDKSLGGGGRYDKLIGIYSGNDIPAVGFAFGFDRVMDALSKLKLLTNQTSASKVLVTIFSKALAENSIKTASILRENNIPTSLWYETDSKLDKQLKYANLKGIPYVVIIGPDEAELGLVTLKDLGEKSQETITLDEAIFKLSS